MHPQVQEWVEWHAFPCGRVLELGSRDVNGSIRSLFSGAFYWGIDIRPGPGVDEVADAATWRTDEPFDIVVCTEVFEHTPTWPALIETAALALRPKGRLIATMATLGRPPHSAIDENPIRPEEWYGNVDPVALVTEVEQWFNEWVVDRRGEPADLRVVADK